MAGPVPLLLAAGLLVGPVPPHPEGYLVLKGALVRYGPREGDLVFFDDRSPTWGVLFALAGTGPPLHMGIVVKRPGGELAVLEAGPDDTVWVELRPLAWRLRQFDADFHGKVTIRRCREALSRQQSFALTRFALLQEGKRYAVLRLLAQGTPFRARGPLAVVKARTHLGRGAWICSELAVAAAVVAGLLGRDEVPANATYPRDLVDDRRHRLGAVWEAEAEWVPASCRRRARR